MNEVSALVRDMEEWDAEYRQRHVAGKSAKELLARGWEKDCKGEWCNPKMERAREKAFKTRNHELLWRKAFGKTGFCVPCALPFLVYSKKKPSRRR